MTAKSIILKHNVDSGLPTAADFEIVEVTVPEWNEELKDALLVQCMVFSADPYLRMGIKTGQKKPGETMSGFVAGKVLKSSNEKWVAGDLFGASLPFTTVQLVTKEVLGSIAIWKLTGLVEEKDISLGVGALGMPGCTAYAGLFDVLRPNKGETIFVSAASGAVGGLVGQMAKEVFDCTVIGSCGGPQKCALITEKMKYDFAIDYKQANNSLEALTARLKDAAPNGIDMYFENVGGIHFQAAMDCLRDKGRVAVCGCISVYNEGVPPLDSICLWKMIYTAQRVEGFVCSPWLTGQVGNFEWLRVISDLWKEGKLYIQQTYTDGIEEWPNAFQSLFTGANVGKVVVRV